MRYLWLLCCLPVLAFAQAEVPSGITNGTIAGPLTVTGGGVTASTGSSAFGATTFNNNVTLADGKCLCADAACIYSWCFANAYWWSTAYVSAPIYAHTSGGSFTTSATSFVNVVGNAPATAGVAVVLDNNTTQTTGTIASFRTGASEKANIAFDGSLLTTAVNFAVRQLPTCSSNTEGQITRDGNSGSGALTPTRWCACSSSGALIPVFTWKNIITGTTGTTTTCAP